MQISSGSNGATSFGVVLPSISYDSYALFAPASTDTVAPDPVTDQQSATGTTTWSIQLEWTAPADNPGRGPVFEYDIKYNTSPISEENWDKSRRIGSIPKPAAPGTRQAMTIEMPDPGTTYYFAIKAIDAAGNISELSVFSYADSQMKDTDHDGMPDSWERTYGFNPNDLSDASLDPDGDGLTNLQEFRKHTNPKDADTDCDNVQDGTDECPNDTDKSEAGICGCGTPDTNSDGDGTPDCQDKCPLDSTKTVPGVCGCGTPETGDSDGDKVPDCLDGCPQDPNKTAPGACGCGEPETGDGDADGMPDCRDNCPEVPNGPQLGTCTAGDNILQTCLNDTECGQGGYCSKNQEDSDGDDVGDACGKILINMTSNTSSMLTGVWGSSAIDVFAVGDYGTILHFDGIEWSSMNSGTTEDLRDIWGSSQNNVFTVGERGTILHFDGSTWSSMESGTTTEALYGVWGSSANDIFAVGSGQTILHFDGSAWSIMKSHESVEILAGVWGSSATDVFAVGGGRSIMHFDGGTWESTEAVLGNDLFAVWGSSASDVFAVGDFGKILHFDGTAWSSMESGKQDDIFRIWYGLWGSSTSNVFAVGDYGTMLHFDGSEWSSLRSCTINILFDVWGSSGCDIFIVGANGTIIRYTDIGDSDRDRAPDVCDNCPGVPNADQLDVDDDAVGNVCDNCPSAANADQRDLDGDGIGDACDSERDGDGVLNADDCAPDDKTKFYTWMVYADTDGDGYGADPVTSFCGTNILPAGYSEQAG